MAAASDLKFALSETIDAFHRARPDIRIEATYGSSGNFYSQLTNKAPFDLFFSADVEYPRRLIEAGLADAESQFQYGVGRVVVWASSDSKLDVEQLQIDVLSQPGVRKIALANPAHAPYGRAAQAALENLGVYQAVKDRLVFGDNIAQAAQMVESGAADVGLIALSLALAPPMKDKGRFWLIPPGKYPPLVQSAVILSWAADRGAAESFRAFVTGREGRDILRRFGFETQEN